MKKDVKILILALIIFLSTILEISKVSLMFSSSYIYIIKPLIWIFIGILCIFFFKNDIVSNMKYKGQVLFYVILSTLIYFLVYFSLGYIKGFAYNPYNNTLNGILLNLWTFVPIIIIKEIVRYYMIQHADKNKIILWAILISLLFAFIDFNILKLPEYFSNIDNIVVFFFQVLMPGIIINMYLTYISYYAGAKGCLIYALLPQIVIYILPILPDINLATISIINSVVPFFSYLFINYNINKMDKTLERKNEKKMTKANWVFFLIFITFMIAFGLGLFKISPIVIGSDSMYPSIKKGDMVIIYKGNVNNVQKGDVIKYKLDNYYVIHRVMEVIDENGEKSFITKGDNNNSIDMFKVNQSQYSGTVRFKIPYIGYPTIILNEAMNKNSKNNVKVELGRID